MGALLSRSSARETDDPALALAAFEAALKTTPNRLGALYGAARSAEAAQQSKKAKGYFETVLAQPKHAPAGRVELVAATTFMARGRSRRWRSSQDLEDVVHRTRR